MTGKTGYMTAQTTYKVIMGGRVGGGVLWPIMRVFWGSNGELYHYDLSLN